MNAGTEIPQRVSQVNDHLNGLSIKLGVALAYIKELSGRLAPVLHDVKESSGSVEPDMPLVPLAERIRVSCKEVESINQQLKIMLDHLEL